MGRGWMWIAAAVLLAVAAGAQDAPGASLVDALGRCTAIRPDAERLACFDAAAAKLVAATRAKDVVVVTKEEVRRTRRSLYGLAIDQNAVFAGRDAPADRIDRLTTTITAVAPGAGDYWSLTLAEGGRWRTTEPWNNAAPKAGMAADIHHGALGSYVLRVPGQTAVRVARVN